MGAQNKIHGKELLKVQAGGQTKNLIVLRGDDTTEFFKAHPLVEAFNNKHGTGLTVVSHPVADIALNFGKTWQSLPIFAVDAAIAYEEPGTALGKEIVFSVQDEPRVVLASGKYQGEKDAALVTLGLTSADIAYTIGGITRTLKEIWETDGIESLLATDLGAVSEIQLLVTNDRLKWVQNFPASSDWCRPHAETGVPQVEVLEPGLIPDRGEEDSPTDDRELCRLYSSYVGLLVRNSSIHIGNCRQGVDARYRASDQFGVVAEVPDADVPKIQAILDKQKEV
jgi:hypothetical protein